MKTATSIEDLLRELVPQVLGVLVRRYGQFEACEDALQEALLDATLQWPRDGVPERPRAWLTAVAARRLADLWRSEVARRRREAVVASMEATHESATADAADAAVGRDDTLRLLFLCCHPALPASAQLALTLRAVGGLTTAEIAAAFLMPEATMSQRIRRAKQRIKAAGSSFQMPEPSEWDARLGVVLHVLYLIFNEGYTASSGPDLQRGELTREAIRLTRTVRRLLPDDGEVAGLLALMLLTDARRPARTTSDGALIPLAEQDRSLWHAPSIAEGVTLITRTLASGPVGPYQLQAAIAAIHTEAPHARDTDWAQILGLYELLTRIAPNPVVTLNHAVALGMAHGPRAGLALLETLDHDERMAGHHRLDAVRAHLLELAGDRVGALDCYRRAARRSTSVPEQRYLEARAARLAGPMAGRRG